MRIDGESMSFDCMPETYRRSNFGELRPGDEVNLERSLTVSARDAESFTVSLVQYTQEHTNLTGAKPGAFVNLESDIIPATSTNWQSAG